MRAMQRRKSGIGSEKTLIWGGNHHQSEGAHLLREAATRPAAEQPLVAVQHRGIDPTLWVLYPAGSSAVRFR